MKTFYRVGNIKNGQGLWYDITGVFTGLIHSSYDFCKNSSLQMPFDKEFIGYLSAVKNLDDLEKWFPKSDMKVLKKYGYKVLQYKADDYKYYNGHWLINQHSSILIRVIK